MCVTEEIVSPRKTANRLILAALLVLACPAFVQAEEPHGEDHEAEALASGAHLRHFKNEVAVFLGLTDEAGHDSEFTWGIDYKRRIAERWAIGGLFDYAGGELRNAVLAPSVSWWPGLGNLQLLAAAGVEYHSGRNSGEHHGDELQGGGCGCRKSSDGHGSVDEDETHFLVRVGVAYDIHIGESFGLVPAVNLDFVKGEEVWVYGLNFTYGF
jgi:hypothetical protein